MHPAKPDLNFFKKKKVENQFGIEIKSINTRILEGLNESESTLRLKRETYLLYPFSEPNRTDKSD